MIRDYNKEHCWQYDIRVNNLIEDLALAGLTLQETLDLEITDFVFQHEDKDTCYKEVKAFIERHEWLGRMSIYPTNIFTARYKGILAGVVIMDLPTVFSHMLNGVNIELMNDDGTYTWSENTQTRRIERLISRGACISWSPKNLGSAIVMFAIRWMVKNTRFRLFVAYSDVEAKELGTIYQACNFYYIGKKSGAKYQYKNEEGRWVSDRYFRSRSVYKRLAKADGIIWQDNWQHETKKDTILFENMPEDTANRIKWLSKNYMQSCEKREMQLKHKYAYVLGKDKRETKYLRKIFIERNKIYPYPKERGN
jgi:hypothetical protein